MTNRVPDEELSILEAIIGIRNRLHALKKDRQTYIKSSTVTEIYDEVTEHVKKLNEIREQATESPTSDNRVNVVLDDVFQLLSLFFMAIGKNNESPATYAQLATIKQCLDHLNESGVYTLDELTPYQNRLIEMSKIIKNDEENNAIAEPHLKLLKKKLKSCETVLSLLLESGSNLSDELTPIHHRLVEIKRELGAIGSRSNLDNTPSFQISEVRPYQDELRSIDSKRVGGSFLAPDGSIPPGQAQVIGLLEECYECAHDLIASQDDVAGTLKPIYHRLIELKSLLEQLTLTHRWTSRETDMWAFQLQLNEIDHMRKNGKFYDNEGNVPEGQTVLLHLLRKCYRLLYKILSSSEPIAEPLMPIHNQLLTVRRFLIEVKKFGGPFTARELYPYQMKLASIDNMRVDGKFLDEDGSIPEGQGIVMALLNECYDILFELKPDVVDDN
ncbi:28_t:CDS:2 [Funneliformis caledonium]|uniref:28_t:CDS:1 n=1 Tax=Funneliformis caledonium TaxID=1117310 RepID=A0A9N8ZKC2_9GLOM|nr:28_t:CDS:2 [Funneliformis caledonium]